ncbi:hypothetical protein NPIL_515672 [Nephila pilipes]|nr:hypothetical protein NPIL_515672 [Nephila pilipes]
MKPPKKEKEMEPPKKEKETKYEYIMRPGDDPLKCEFEKYLLDKDFRDEVLCLAKDTDEVSLLIMDENYDYNVNINLVQAILKISFPCKAYTLVLPRYNAVLAALEIYGELYEIKNRPWGGFLFSEMVRYGKFQEKRKLMKGNLPLKRDMGKIIVEATYKLSQDVPNADTKDLTTCDEISKVEKMAKFKNVRKKKIMKKKGKLQPNQDVEKIEAERTNKPQQNSQSLNVSNTDGQSCEKDPLICDEISSYEDITLEINYSFDHDPFDMGYDTCSSARRKEIEYIKEAMTRIRSPSDYPDSSLYTFEAIMQDPERFFSNTLEPAPEEKMASKKSVGRGSKRKRELEESVEDESESENEVAESIFENEFLVPEEDRHIFADSMWYVNDDEVRDIVNDTLMLNFADLEELNFELIPICCHGVESGYRADGTKFLSIGGFDTSDDEK